MTDCALCRLMDGIFRSESVAFERASESCEHASESVAFEHARAAFLCGVATGEYLAYRGSADLCARCAETVARARAVIRAAAVT